MISNSNSQDCPRLLVIVVIPRILIFSYSEAKMFKLYFFLNVVCIFLALRSALSAEVPDSNVKSVCFGVLVNMDYNCCAYLAGAENYQFPVFGERQ